MAQCFYNYLLTLKYKVVVKILCFLRSTNYNISTIMFESLYYLFIAHALYPHYYDNQTYCVRAIANEMKMI